MNPRYILAIMFSFLIFNAHPFDLDVSVSDSILTVGEPFDYKICAEKDSCYPIKLPFMDEKESVFNVIYKTNISGGTEKGCGSGITYRLAAFQTGELTVPGAVFTDGEDTVSSDSVKVRVVSVLPDSVLHDTSGPPPFAPIKPEAVMGSYAEEILAAAIVVLIFSLAAFYLLRRNSHRGSLDEIKKPALPPHIMAYQELDKVEAEALPSKGQYRKFCFSLSFVLRRYLGLRYGFYALESTTEELLERIVKISMPEDIKKRIGELCLAEDTVKFAGRIPTVSECDRMLLETRKIVDLSKPGPGSGGPST
ncbi:MAG: BatD family protein [Fibrobacterota bacterium]